MRGRKILTDLVEGHGGGEDQGVLMASLATIYRDKNSHSHMIKSHDWLKQNINRSQVYCIGVGSLPLSIQNCSVDSGKPPPNLSHLEELGNDGMCGA
jgi:hypothetical protein